MGRRRTAHVIAAVAAAGYRGATTTEPGVAHPGVPFVLPRIRVDGDETPRAPHRLRAADLHDLQRHVGQSILN